VGLTKLSKGKTKAFIMGIAFKYDWDRLTNEYVESDSVNITQFFRENDIKDNGSNRKMTKLHQWSEKKKEYKESIKAGGLAVVSKDTKAKIRKIVSNSNFLKEFKFAEFSFLKNVIGRITDISEEIGERKGEFESNLTFLKNMDKIKLMKEMLKDAIDGLENYQKEGILDVKKEIKVKQGKGKEIQGKVLGFGME